MRRTRTALVPVRAQLRRCCQYVHQNRVVFYAVFAFSLAIASSNCPEREFAAFNLRFDVIRTKRKSGGKFQNKVSTRGEVYLPHENDPKEYSGKIWGGGCQRP